jgi:hypothetical protein
MNNIIYFYLKKPLSISINGLSNSLLATTTNKKQIQLNKEVPFKGSTCKLCFNKK